MTTRKRRQFPSLQESPAEPSEAGMDCEAAEQRRLVVVVESVE